jgi:glycolate oxidase FAD binding subunit
MQSLRPADEDETSALIAEAYDRGMHLDVVGHGTRRHLRPPCATDQTLELARLSGVTLYEPTELVLTAKAATPLRQIEALLAAERQHLAFEPPDFGPLWGKPAGLGTLGGAISTGLGGARRATAGGPRDHLLGFRAINGYGERFAAGGRVVKNVTGFDLPKLMAGAFGQLGVMTEVTVKVLPRARMACTLAILGLDEVVALSFLRQALASQLPVSAAAFVPADIAGQLPPGARAQLDGRSAALLRLDGSAPGLAAAMEELALGAARRCDRIVLGGADHQDLWRAISGAWLFAGSLSSVWRITAPPASAAALGAQLRPLSRALFYDWAGGLIWLDTVVGGRTLHRVLQQAAPTAAARLVRGRDPSPSTPLDAAVMRLNERVRAQFDPRGVFN